MYADIDGALAQINTSWKTFEYHGKRMTKAQVKAVLEYGKSMGYTSTKQLCTDPEVDAIIKRIPRTLGDFDVWYQPCEHCGYDTAKSTEQSENRCWKCGRRIYRDYSDRALKR